MKEDAITYEVRKYLYFMNIFLLYDNPVELIDIVYGSNNECRENSILVYLFVKDCKGHKRKMGLHLMKGE